jgi:high-affinity Fe2+/Pb2+ permease
MRQPLRWLAALVTGVVVAMMAAMVLSSVTWELHLRKANQQAMLSQATCGQGSRSAMPGVRMSRGDTARTS